LRIIEVKFILLMKKYFLKNHHSEYEEFDFKKENITLMID